MHRFIGVTTTTINVIVWFVLNFLLHIANAQRERRFILPFTESSTVGLIVAVATPVDIPNREVFFSYNFEANYNLPDSQFVNYPLEQYGIGRSEAESPVSNATNTEKHQPKNHHKKHKSKQKSKTDIEKANKDKMVTTRLKRSLLSRKTAYRIFEEKLIAFGYNGRSCLLKAICQASETPLGDYNGVLGDVVHVILTPSSSKDDGISKQYYEAEYNGYLGDCSRYATKCPKTITDFISVIK